MKRSTKKIIMVIVAVVLTVFLIWYNMRDEREYWDFKVKDYNYE